MGNILPSDWNSSLSPMSTYRFAECRKVQLIKRTYKSEKQSGNHPLRLWNRIWERITNLSSRMSRLIEGASTGKGLGIKFLRHIERTKILFHLISANRCIRRKDYKIINKKRTETHNKELAEKQNMCF